MTVASRPDQVQLRRAFKPDLPRAKGFPVYSGSRIEGTRRTKASKNETKTSEM